MSGNIEELRVKAPVSSGRERRLSLQVPVCSRDVRKSKSLPCVNFCGAVGGSSGGVVKCGSGSLGPERLPKKPFSQRPKILRKTWDRVKGIINSPSSSSSGGCSRGNEGGAGKCSGVGSCSAPSTPLKGEQVFFGEQAVEGERDRIARNYALLQKRLSQEFRQSSLKGRGGAFGGEFSDEFKRKLFEWEGHPSRRKGKADGKECAGGGGGGSSSGSGGVGGLSSRHLKELAWLDKQLEKIEAEKKRLEEELKKQVEREIRVQKMKEAIRCSVNDRVYNIRTESGVKVRVEGITSEYAMKVYEWETKRGIGVEMSALGYFDPKYRDYDDEEDAGDKVTENCGERGKGGGGCEEEVEEEQKEDEIVGPLDLINERLKKLESEGGGDRLGERGEMLLAECVALGEVASGGSGVGVGAGEADGRVSSTASSCCCSAEYEYEHTDSFATKNNSGASNTDSEVYDKRCTITRRRSSDCVSTPDRGSPGLSAFTSEEEEGVKEEEEEEKKPEGEEVSAGACGVDKGRGGGGDGVGGVPLCVKQIVIDEEVPGFGDCNVFVQTKRTIFSPVVEDEVGCGGARVVGAIPKVGYKPQPKTQFHRVFPGNVPVYCSPMAARRAFNEERAGSSGCGGGEFSIDRFLQDRGIGRFGCGGGRKLPPRTNAHVPRKYTIGGGFPPAFGRGCVIARSSSFNGEKGEEERGGGCNVACGDGRFEGEGGGFVGGGGGSINLSKSKSTGSIKRSFASVRSFLGFGKGGGSVGGGGSVAGGSIGSGDVSVQQQPQQQQVPLQHNNSGEFSERRGSKSGAGFVRRFLWRGKEGD